MIAPYNCVVVANGRFPQTALPLHLLHQASVVIACDGAVEAGITPTAIVGDLDSIPSRFREQYAGRIHIVEDQEINDLTKSVRFAHRSEQQEVLILGATGLREDHTLGNISLLMDYAPLFQRIEMLSDYGIFTPILQTTTLESKPGTQVSLFSLAPSAWWQGTLNEATGNNFTVTLSADARIIVYRTLQIM